MVAARFAVSVLVIVCTTTGAPPPIGTSLTHIWRLEAIPTRVPGLESCLKGARESRSVTPGTDQVLSSLGDPSLQLEWQLPLACRSVVGS